MDLNRNFDYKWGYNELGSTANICSEMYRGSEPFSEPESRAIRDLIVGWPNIRVSYNLHAFGNYAITPMSWENLDNRYLKMNFPKAANFYK